MKNLFRLFCGFVTALASAAAVAAAYPDRTVTIVVPFPAGGTTDILARHLAQALTDEWKQSVVVENKGGASGTIGSAQVAKSKPDGYTLVDCHTPHHQSILTKGCHSL